MSAEGPLILVVDDESDSLAFLFDLLHNEGFRVLPSADPIEALEQVTRKQPDLLITDLRMPDLDGLELMERTKAISPRTRVILLTAYGDWSLARDVMRRGGETMLLKPSSNEEILKCVRHALEQGERCSR